MNIISDSVMIGFPHYGKVDTPFMLSVVGLIYYDSRNRDIIKSCEGFYGLYIAQNRNEIVKSFLSRPLEWLLFLDPDLEFPKDILYNLLAEADPIEKPIISGLYFGHVGEQVLNVLPLWNEEKENNEFAVISHIPVNSLVKLSACGMGCCLIHRNVFEKFPDINDNYKWFGHDIALINGEYKRLGEDFTFCQRARTLGFDIWGHSGVMLNHYKVRPENIESFLQASK